MIEIKAPVGAAAEAAARPGYGRARLWLGIAAVGTWVTLAAVGLLGDLPGAVQARLPSGFAWQLAGLAVFVLSYTLLHLPLDLLGGSVLPHRFGRAHTPPGRYLAGLARGVAVHAALLFLAAAVLLTAGRFGGVAGTVAAGLLMVVALLAGRTAIAAAVAPLRCVPVGPTSGRPVALADSPDEGFTGGVVGVFRPGRHLLPRRWQEALGPDGFGVAGARREAAVRSGSWARGRAAAVAFTAAGLTAAALVVGPGRLGTAGGTIELSLWFTLWSFLGLLTLPTLSRRGVREIDGRFLAAGGDRGELEDVTRRLDRLQDDEPDRPGLVEAVFHPIPSRRRRGAGAGGAVGGWDAARTAVYLGLAGLGLLGRAVHCNCGRPALWVFLPAD